MLKPIHRVDCSPALAACQQLMQTFALWLCDLSTTPTDLTQQGLQPPILPSAIEADWLWNFLQRVDAGQSLLSRAQTLAAMPGAEKTAMIAWVHMVSALPMQFQPAPAQWPVNRPLVSDAHWKAFKTLLEAFYEKGFRAGLPYLANGTPAVVGGVSYANYVNIFRDKHRLNPNPNASEVCILCGGPLGDTPHVDHWINKSTFPLLSICEDNLALICSTCNEAPNKGDKPVHSSGSFEEWFHPYLCPGNTALQLNYVLPELAVRCVANATADQPRADNLDQLLNLSNRWTKKFKSEYASKQKELFNLKQRGRGPSDFASLRNYLIDYQIGMDETGPDYEVRQALAAALLEPSRLAAWHSDLDLAP
ncbi:MAG: HNH endonuclease [Methylobacter sp.]